MSKRNALEYLKSKIGEDLFKEFAKCFRADGCVAESDNNEPICHDSNDIWYFIMRKLVPDHWVSWTRPTSSLPVDDSKIDLDEIKTWRAVMGDHYEPSVIRVIDWLLKQVEG